MDKVPPEHVAKTDEELETEIRELNLKKKELVRQVWNVDSELIARKEILFRRRQKRVDIPEDFDAWDD